MTKYYTTELNNSESNRKWESTNAKTLNGAKSVSKKRQIFVGTVCAVGIDRGERGIERAAVTRFDGSWIEID